MFAKTLPAYTHDVEICQLDDQELKKFRNKKQKAWGKTGALKGIQQTHVWKEEGDGKSPQKCILQKQATMNGQLSNNCNKIKLK